jgi:hypothetical protein
MSLIRQVVESMANTLKDHAYFRTVPVIPVLVQDHKDIDREIENAMNKSGAFVMVNFQNAETGQPDTPGPYMDNASFAVTCSEIPSVWRQQAGNMPKPSATEIGEAVARILHHHIPLDINGAALSGGLLTFTGMQEDATPPMLSQIVTFNCPIGLHNTTPTR